MLNDVQVRYANTNDMPFVAISGKHGYSNSLGKVKHGVGINLRKLNSVKVTKDGRSATIGGGILTKRMVEALWEKGKLSSKLSFLQHRGKDWSNIQSVYSGWLLRMYRCSRTHARRRTRMAAR
jgi:hypothetical protein